jgi:hypothetical protein
MCVKKMLKGLDKTHGSGDTAADAIVGVALVVVSSLHFPQCIHTPIAVTPEHGPLLLCTAYLRMAVDICCCMHCVALFC